MPRRTKSTSSRKLSVSTKPSRFIFICSASPAAPLISTLPNRFSFLGRSKGVRESSPSRDAMSSNPACENEPRRAAASRSRPSQSSPRSPIGNTRNASFVDAHPGLFAQSRQHRLRQDPLVAYQLVGLPACEVADVARHPRNAGELRIRDPALFPGEIVAAQLQRCATVGEHPTPQPTPSGVHQLLEYQPFAPGRTSRLAVRWRSRGPVRIRGG